LDVEAGVRTCEVAFPFEGKILTTAFPGNPVAGVMVVSAFIFAVGAAGGGRGFVAELIIAALVVDGDAGADVVSPVGLLLLRRL